MLARGFLCALLGEFGFHAQRTAGIFQKIDPLARRLHQRQIQLRAKQLRHNAGKPCARANIHHTPAHLRARGQQQAVDEMTVLNAFGIRNGGKVYFLIVFHQQRGIFVQLPYHGSCVDAVSRRLPDEALCINHSFYSFPSLLRRFASSTARQATSAGPTPGIRAACPTERGRIFASFSRASRRKPVNGA